MRLYCYSCREFMNLIDVGIIIKTKEWYWSADLYECPKCGALIALTGEFPFQIVKEKTQKTELKHAYCHQ